MSLLYPTPLALARWHSRSPKDESCSKPYQKRIFVPFTNTAVPQSTSLSCTNAPVAVFSTFRLLPSQHSTAVS